MNRKISQELCELAERIAQDFSHPDRAMNFDMETFQVDTIAPLSETTAYIVFKKYNMQNSLTRKSVAFCYYMRAKKQWRYFFPGESHALGMLEFWKILLQITIENFKRDFQSKGDVS